MIFPKINIKQYNNHKNCIFTQILISKNIQILKPYHFKIFIPSELIILSLVISKILYLIANSLYQ